MARGRFAEEFREEAVRQVVERGYSVTDVAKRHAAEILNFIKTLS